MDSIDLAFSFDTTESMYPCLPQVRRNVQDTVRDLFLDIPNLRVAIMAHGDYCDKSRILTILDFTSDEDKICKFVQTVNATCGGDEDEAYEFVLNRARTLSWTGGKNKALVVIGDCSPHKVGYKYGKIKNDLDWRNEAQLLVESGISIYPIQCLNRAINSPFYDGLANISSTTKLNLNQFHEINDFIQALCYKQAGKLNEFEKKLEKRGNVSYNVISNLDTLAGRDISIKDFVERNGFKF